METIIKELLKQAVISHGGSALTNLQTFTEGCEIQVSGPLGIRAPAQQCHMWLDHNAERGRWQISIDKEMEGIYQHIPNGVFLWAKKSGTQKLPKANAPFFFLPVLKTGVIGLLALTNTNDPLSYVASGEIKGKKGRMLVRAQTAAQQTLFLLREGVICEPCQTTWSYLFAADGTLIAERMTQTQSRRMVDVQMGYDRFQNFGGIKVPTEISVKSNQVPKGFALKMKVKQVTVNAPIAATIFQMP